MRRLASKFKRLSQTPKDESSQHTANPTISNAPAMTDSNVEDAKVDQMLVTSPARMQQDCPSPLESLPPEVRRQLLSTMDLEGLQALVRASPTFHQQYLEDRRYLLCKCLEMTLGSVTVDAYAVHVSDPASECDMLSVLNSYSDHISRRWISLADKLTEPEALKMVDYYRRFVKPMIQHFARSALKELENDCDISPKLEQERVALTDAETMRVTRAIYRFQLVSHVANPIEERTSVLERELKIVFDILEPWEIEEFYSFYQFAARVYDETFKKIHWDLDSDNPKFDDQDRPHTPDGAFDFDSSVARNNYIEGTTLCGLPLLNTVVFKIKDPDHLVSTMQQHIVSSYIPLNTIEGVLGERHQGMALSLGKQRCRRQMMLQRLPFPFRGDGEPDAPPKAWTTIWGGTYSSLYGWYIIDEMRSWGYVFWDASTLEATGAGEVLKSQWWSDYYDYDPRVDLRD